MVKRKEKIVERSVDFLNEDEWLAREQRFMQRLQDLRISVGFINDANKEYTQLQTKQMALDKWNDYLACDGLPRAEDPAQIRHYILKLSTEEQQAATADINWVLSVNERSILSHAPDRTDMTRRHLEETLRPNIGKLYDDTVQGILETHRRVEQVLRNEIELLEMPSQRALELTKIPGELHEEIETFFDKLSYRVICAPEAYMTNKGSMLSYYCYNCSNFNFQIWGLQDVPIRFQYLKLPLMYSDLKCTGVTLQLPLSVLSDNLTLRCVHTFFDPYSHLAKSYELNVDTMTAPSCGIVDIEDSLTSEWMTQVDIQEEMMAKMEAQMEAYNQAMSVVEAAVAAKEKRKGQGENEKGPPIPKAPKMPVALPEGKFPDPYKIFLEQTKRECTNFFNENFHPNHIDLLAYEVNLRRYIIMGGVFSLVFVRKPKHTAFEKLNLTLHEDGRILQVLLNQLDLTRDSTMARLPRMSTESQVPSRINTNIDSDGTKSEMKLHLEPEELPFYFVTFQLPAHLCLWGEPFVCQFIEEEIEDPEIEEEILVEETDKKSKKKRLRKTESVKSGKDAKRKSSKPEKIIIMPDEKLISNQAKPNQRNRSSANIYSLTAVDMIRKSTLEAYRSSGELVPNFVLNLGPLSSRRASLLNKLCMPRIISSFKFPKEFRDEQLDEQATKKATGPIYRRRFAELADSPEEMKEFTLSYEDQADPERLYPRFPQLEEEQKLDKIEKERVSRMGDDFGIVDSSLYGLIQTLDDIKSQYEDSPKKLTGQARSSHAVRGFKRHYQEPKEVSTRATRNTINTRRTASSGFGNSLLPVQLPSVHSDKELELEGRESESTLNETPRKSKLISQPISQGPRRPVTIKVSHWTTEFILESDFNKESMILTVKTDRLGNFGFAYPRYSHFPFRNWQLEANEQNLDEIIFTLDTCHVRVVFIVSKDGIRGYATDVPKEYVAKLKKYLDIEKPVRDFVELRKRFQDMNLNVFAELDACFYIDQGYFSQKHLAAELHIYDTMTVHCKLMKFKRSDWNRLATDRDILLCLRNMKEALDSVEVTVRVTPEASTFVEVSELCSDDLDTIKLHYQPTWRNIGIYSDLHQLINSMYPSATDVRNRDARQMYYLRKLLQEIRPLSFS